MKQINASRDHIIARVIARISVLPLRSAMGSSFGLARFSCTGIYIMKWTKLLILWFRILWRRLQPVGFGPCKDEPPQAEACATNVQRVGAAGSAQSRSGS